MAQLPSSLLHSPRHTPQASCRPFLIHHLLLRPTGLSSPKRNTEHLIPLPTLELSAALHQPAIVAVNPRKRTPPPLFVPPPPSPSSLTSSTISFTLLNTGGPICRLQPYPPPFLVRPATRSALPASGETELGRSRRLAISHTFSAPTSPGLTSVINSPDARHSIAFRP